MMIGKSKIKSVLGGFLVFDCRYFIGSLIS
jgi:hypothetical protein